MRVHVIPVTLFQSNCIIVWEEESGDAALFDPGGDAPRIISFVERNSLNVKGIYLTHGHVDHVSGSNSMKAATKAPIHLHAADRELALAVPRQCAMFGIPLEDPPEIDAELAEGAVYCVGSLEFKVLHTPGHSPGGVCFHFTQEGSPLLISGDLLFANSIGRTDLPGGNARQMKESLDRLLLFPDDLSVIPGHGPRTTIGRERLRNPFLQGGIDW